MKTNELTGAALNWAVAKCEGKRPSLFIFTQTGKLASEHNYSTDWAHGGPIIERELLAPEPLLDENCVLIKWCCRNWRGDGADHYGPTPLIAAMRCYVASKLGDNIDIPKELTC